MQKTWSREERQQRAFDARRQFQNLLNLIFMAQRDSGAELWSVGALGEEDVGRLKLAVAAN